MASAGSPPALTSISGAPTYLWVVNAFLDILYNVQKQIAISYLNLIIMKPQLILRHKEKEIAAL